VDKKHELLCELKEQTASLGRVPHRDEFVAQSKHTKHDMVKAFGTYTEFTKAAGLDKKSIKQSTKKQVDKFFQKSISEYIPKNEASLSGELFPRVVILGDTHFPWADQNALTLVYTMIEKLKPEYVVQIGDLFDLYAYSRWPKSQYQFSPQEEVSLARQMAEKMWNTIHQIADVKCIQLLGNHCIRPHRAVISAGLGELEPYFNFNALYDFKDVKTIFDPREPLTMGSLTFIHGFLSGLGGHISHFGTHVIHGHTHRGGLIYKRHFGKSLFELDVGYLGDTNAKCFTFTSSKVTNWTKGIGFIHELGPMWIPFE
jgi:hypothetical protein